MNNEERIEFIKYFRKHNNLWDFVRHIPQNRQYDAYIAIRERERLDKNKYNKERRKELVTCPNCKQKVKKGSIYYHKQSKICKLVSLIKNGVE